MKFLAPLLVFVVLATLIATGIALAATNGSAVLLLIAVAIFVGLFVKFGCLSH
jgi:hypothetical protein